MKNTADDQEVTTSGINIPISVKETAKGYEASETPSRSKMPMQEPITQEPITMSKQKESIASSYESETQAATMPKTRKQDEELSIPPLEGLSQQDPVLTNTVRSLLKSLWAIAVSKAIQHRFPIISTKVTIFDDPTEGERKAVLRLYCRANLDQSLPFWDSLEEGVQNLLNALNATERTTFITKIDLRVHWE